MAKNQEKSFLVQVIDQRIVMVSQINKGGLFTFVHVMVSEDGEYRVRIESDKFKKAKLIKSKGWKDKK